MVELYFTTYCKGAKEAKGEAFVMCAKFEVSYVFSQFLRFTFVLACMNFQNYVVGLAILYQCTDQ